MINIEFGDFKQLRCGENEHQSAYISKLNGSIDYEILSREKELSYLDYLNLSTSLRVCCEFFDVNCLAIAKNNSICSIALGATLLDAFEKILESNPVAITNSTICCSKELTIEVAKQIKSMSVKNVIAPSFSKEAFSYLLDTDLKMILIRTPLHEIQGFNDYDVKVTPFGALIQEQNVSKLTKESFNVVTQSKPTQQQAEDAIFGWKISKYLKSNCALVVKDLSTKAIIQGATCEIDAVEQSMDVACENSKDAILVVNNAINNIESINAAIQGRIGLVIEPGDGANSQKILKYADKYNLSMIFTKLRNCKY